MLLLLLLPVTAAALSIPRLQTPFLPPLSPSSQQPPNLNLEQSSQILSFTPRHAAHHPVDLDRPSAYTAEYVNDEHDDSDQDRLPTLTLSAVPQTIYKPRIKPLSPEWHARRHAEIYQGVKLWSNTDWEESTILGPNVSDLNTLSTLAKMSANAYDEHHPKNEDDDDDDGRWFPIPGRWNWSSSFGWKENGIRGHVFATPDNSTIVIAIKGTSTSFIGGGGPTSRQDKINDNLLFSCCCARVDWSWSTVCDCYAGGYKCNESCLEKALVERSAYYPVATDLFSNLTAKYPYSNIWLTGHSLGGSLASILAISFGIPCVTFEAPAEYLAARRLHLPLPPPNVDGSVGGVTHVWHTADPIPQGSCTGFSSSCALAGFALESKCHAGRTVVYDTVEKLGWSVDIRTHTIKTVVEKLLIKDWDADAVAKSLDTHEEQQLQHSSDPLALVPICKSINSYAQLDLCSYLSNPFVKFWWGWWPGHGDEDEDGSDEPKEPIGLIPKPSPQLDCHDCDFWEFGDGEEFQ